VDLLSDRLLMMMNDKFLVFGIRLYMTVVPPFYKVSNGCKYLLFWTAQIERDNYTYKCGIY
jgi:hypothetical protein